MPITQERLYALMHESEKLATILHTTHETIASALKSSLSAESKLDMIGGLLHEIGRIQSPITENERRHYNSHARRNVSVRERMRLQRRANGIPERTPPGSPSQLLEEYHARKSTKAEDDLYARFNKGEAVEEPFIDDNNEETTNAD